MSSLNAHDALRDSILTGAQKHDLVDRLTELAIGAIVHDVDRTPAQKAAAIAARIARRDQDHVDLTYPELITAERRLEEMAHHHLEQQAIAQLVADAEAVRAAQAAATESLLPDHGAMLGTTSSARLARHREIDARYIRAIAEDWPHDRCITELGFVPAPGSHPSNPRIRED